MRGAVLVLCGLVVGCDDAPPTCLEPPALLRNPQNLHCDERLAPSPTCEVSALPTWVSCRADPCTGIESEGACLDEPGCRVAYDDCLVSGDPCYSGNAFLACFGVDLAGPAGGACDGLDAQDCSSRDDCAAWFIRGPQCPPGPDPDDGPDGPPGPGRAPAPDGEGCFLTYSYCLTEPDSPITIR